MKRKSSWNHLFELAPYQAVATGWARAWTSVRRHAQQRAAMAQAEHAARKDQLRAAHMAVGSALFTVLVFLAAAYPFVLPHLYLAFAATALPWRLYTFAVASPRNAFFLLDFCYWVNAAVAAFLLLPAPAQDPRLEAALYALADVPVAAALVAWQCAW